MRHMKAIMFTLALLTTSCATVLNRSESAAINLVYNKIISCDFEGAHKVVSGIGGNHFKYELPNIEPVKSYPKELMLEYINWLSKLNQEANQACPNSTFNEIGDFDVQIMCLRGFANSRLASRHDDSKFRISRQATYFVGRYDAGGNPVYRGDKTDQRDFPFDTFGLEFVNGCVQQRISNLLVEKKTFELKIEEENQIRLAEEKLKGWAYVIETRDDFSKKPKSKIKGECEAVGDFDSYSSTFNSKWRNQGMRCVDQKEIKAMAAELFYPEKGDANITCMTSPQEVLYSNSPMVTAKLQWLPTEELCKKFRNASKKQLAQLTRRPPPAKKSLKEECREDGPARRLAEASGGKAAYCNQVRSSTGFTSADKKDLLKCCGYWKL